MTNTVDRSSALSSRASGTLECIAWLSDARVRYKITDFGIDGDIHGSQHPCCLRQTAIDKKLSCGYMISNADAPLNRRVLIGIAGLAEAALDCQNRLPRLAPRSGSSVIRSTSRFNVFCLGGHDHIRWLRVPSQADSPGIR